MKNYELSAADGYPVTIAREKNWNESMRAVYMYDSLAGVSQMQDDLMKELVQKSFSIPLTKIAAKGIFFRAWPNSLLKEILFFSTAVEWASPDLNINVAGVMQPGHEIGTTALADMVENVVHPDRYPQIKGRFDTISLALTRWAQHDQWNVKYKAAGVEMLSFNSELPKYEYDDTPGKVDIVHLLAMAHSQLREKWIRYIETKKAVDGTTKITHFKNNADQILFTLEENAGFKHEHISQLIAGVGANLWSLTQTSNKMHIASVNNEMVAILYLNNNVISTFKAKDPGELINIWFADDDGDGVPNLADQCSTVAGTVGFRWCPAGLRVSVEEVDALTKPATHKDASLETKVFNASFGSCAYNIGIKPQNYAQIYTDCEAENTQSETFSPNDGKKLRNRTSDLMTIGVTNGTKLVLVQSEASADGTFSYMGFDVPNMLAGQSRNVGFNIVSGQPNNFVQTALFTKDSKGSRGPSSRAQVIQGSELQIFQPDYVLWNGTEQIYPFTFISDSDRTVDVCLQVPEGYQIVEPGTCGQTFVINETKVFEFKTVDVGSPKEFDATVRIKVKHKGKTANVKLKPIKSINLNAWKKK